MEDEDQNYCSPSGALNAGHPVVSALWRYFSLQSALASSLARVEETRSKVWGTGAASPPSAETR